MSHLSGGRACSKSVDNTGHQYINGGCHVGTSHTLVLFYQLLISLFWPVVCACYELCNLEIILVIIELCRQQWFIMTTENCDHLMSLIIIFMATFELEQVAQLVQRDRTAWRVSFGQKWKMIFCRQYRSIFNHCDVIDLQSYRIWWNKAK